MSVRHRELNPDMVTHLSTNRARRRLTSLIEANALTTTPDHQPWSCDIVVGYKCVYSYYILLLLLLLILLFLCNKCIADHSMLPYVSMASITGGGCCSEAFLVCIRALRHICFVQRRNCTNAFMRGSHLTIIFLLKSKTKCQGFVCVLTTRYLLVQCEMIDWYFITKYKVNVIHVLPVCFCLFSHADSSVH